MSIEAGGRGVTPRPHSVLLGGHGNGEGAGDGDGTHSPLVIQPTHPRKVPTLCLVPRVPDGYNSFRHRPVIRAWAHAPTARHRKGGPVEIIEYADYL